MHDYIYVMYVYTKGWVGGSTGDVYPWTWEEIWDQPGQRGGQEVREYNGIFTSINILFFCVNLVFSF